MAIAGGAAREAVVSLVLVGAVAVAAGLAHQSGLGLASGLLVGLRAGWLEIHRRHEVLAGLGGLVVAEWVLILRFYLSDDDPGALFGLAISLVTWSVGLAAGRGFLRIRRA
jgi:hypothetical protein